MSIYSQTDMESLGVTNVGWGVCGFTSSFYAMYDQDQSARPQIINATKAYRVLAEIKTYLHMLQAENSPLLKDITAFTQSFGGQFKTFSIRGYIEEINRAAAQNLGTPQIVMDSKFGIAMPPAAVADYLKRMWQKNTNIAEGVTSSLMNSGIVGVSKSAFSTQEPYHGLKHYLYYKNGTLYSWGNTYSSVQQAMGGSAWKVVYVISIV